MSPENWWFEDEVSCWNGPFPGFLPVLGRVSDLCKLLKSSSDVTSDAWSTHLSLTYAPPPSNRALWRAYQPLVSLHKALLRLNPYLFGWVRWPAMIAVNGFFRFTCTPSQSIKLLRFVWMSMEKMHRRRCVWKPTGRRDRFLFQKATCGDKNCGTW